MTLGLPERLLPDSMMYLSIPAGLLLRGRQSMTTGGENDLERCWCARVGDLARRCNRAIDREDERDRRELGG
jgi:hypothetical protein